MTEKFFKKVITFSAGATIVAVINLLVLASYDTLLLPQTDSYQYISRVQAASRSEVGIASYVSSYPKSGDKKTIMAKINEAGMKWDREEYTYSGDMNWAPYDAAYGLLRGSGIHILGLLTYPGPDVSHEAWKEYVEAVTDRYSGVSAWEIMNEIDNHLSAADYTPYLKEAYEIIKEKSDATVVCSGLTARWEVYPFWDGIKAAGGWDYFDQVGLHIFHDGPPGEDSYNNGTLPQEVQKVINSINKNGGGKGIWVTEFGFDSNAYGLENQASWMTEGLGIVSGFGEVGKIFIYRMSDRDTAHGMLTSSFSDKPVYGAVKNWLSGISTPAPAPAPVAVQTTSPVAGGEAEESVIQEKQLLSRQIKKNRSFDLMARTLPQMENPNIEL